MTSVLNRIETGHLDLIHDAKADFYGKLLATCSSDRSVKIYQLRPNGQHVPIAKLTEHQAPVWQLSWAHPMYGDLLASCSYDRKVIVWKGVNCHWSKGAELVYHESSVNTVSWAPKEYGLTIAFGSSDGTVSVVALDADLNVKKHTKIADAHTNGCNAISWAPPAKVGSMCVPSDQADSKDAMLASGGSDGLIKIWKDDGKGEWQQKFSLQGHRDWIRDVEWDPMCTATCHRLASCSQDCTVTIWRSGNLTNPWTKTTLPKFDDSVWGVSWSACGMFLAVSYGDNKVSVWKENGEQEWIDVSEEKGKQKKTPSPWKR